MSKAVAIADVNARKQIWDVYGELEGGNAVTIVDCHLEMCLCRYLESAVQRGRGDGDDSSVF